MEGPEKVNKLSCHLRTIADHASGRRKFNSQKVKIVIWLIFLFVHVIFTARVRVENDERRLPQLASYTVIVVA